jgi:hypothetical protein
VRAETAYRFHSGIGLNRNYYVIADYTAGGRFIPGTIFRSPARLLYFTQFALAVALGCAIQVAYATQARIARFVVALLLTVHVIDLGSHDRGSFSADRCCLRLN